MKTTNSKHLNLFLAIALATTAACGSDSKGGDDDDDDNMPTKAYLTVVGDSNVFLENGWTHRLSVRYHGADNQALAGSVDFRVVGGSGGGNLLDSSGVTNSDGIVQVDLVAGSAGDALFTIEAAAAAADSVTWQIAVTEGAKPLAPLDATGSYSMGSEFDVTSGLPGAAGTIINSFIEMTDDPYDPATFVIDALVEELDSGFVEGLISVARPALDGLVNEMILAYSPDFIDDIMRIGDLLGQLTREFGIVSTLDIQAATGIEGHELGATHVIAGVTFDIDGADYTFSMADIGEEDIVVSNVAFRMNSETKVIIGEHSFPLSYGSVLMLALNQVIIPLIDPRASDLYELLEGMVDCYAVGVEVANYVGFGSPSLYEGACTVGLAAVASEIEMDIRDIDSAGVVLTISGDATPQDTNTDRKVDVLRGGQWEGTISYGDTQATLARPDNTFRAERMEPR